ncbi:MAG: AI-2E family transporter [Kofleriaceae bacterium]|nr:AI-2E family transporter [Kofleriaceae bacterium]MCL4228884.1 AI-2E family transporter [Myxococcales bacterium]
MSTPNPPQPPRSLATDPLVFGMVRWLLIIVFVVLGWFVLSSLAAILAPILAALGIAYLLDPVLERLVARGMSRAVAATVLLVAFLGAVTGLMIVLVPIMIHQFAVFIDELPEMIERASVWIGERTDIDLQQHLNAESLQEMLQQAAGPLEHMAEVALGGAFAVLGFLAEVLLVPVFAYYFLLDWKHIQERVKRIIPPRNRGKVLDILAQIDGVVSGWVRGQAIVTTLLAILYAIAFWIIGVPLAIPLGLLVGALTIIPFVGTFVGAAVTGIVIVLQWPGPEVPIYTTAVFVGLHLLEAAVLTPKIVGHKVGLSESAALFAVVAGGKLLGFVGILLAVPLAATVAVLLRHAIRTYEKSHFFGSESDALVDVSPAMALVMTDERTTGTRATAQHPAVDAPDEPDAPDAPPRGPGDPKP